MIFYHPVDNKPGYRSGSTLRPEMMREAFRQLGYRVIEVCGSSAARAQSIRAIQRGMNGSGGGQPGFLYMETANVPIALSDRHHLPLRPRMDLGFLEWLKRYHVPIGVFIRDAYWCFADLVPPWYRVLVVPFFEHELRMVSELADVVFVPSMRMLDYLPIRPLRVCELPPGARVDILTSKRTCGDGCLRLLYIGSISPPEHDITPILRAAAELGPRGILELTICCYEREAKLIDRYYVHKGLDPRRMSNARVVHQWGDSVRALYERSDISVMVTEKCAYLGIAMPIKIFESLGFGIPVLANAGTPYGEFLERTGMGWAVEPNAGALVAAVGSLASNVAEADRARERIRECVREHTWYARAEYARDMLAPPECR